MNNSPVRRKFAEVGSDATKLGREQCGFRAYFSQKYGDCRKKSPPVIGGPFQIHLKRM
jgi:hypothetical protein